ncbi:MAG: thermonuclease family protein [Chloroflexi bacterium]|nr:thermonuclease family protein [Chloroflexota bacterium]MBU1750185.1 thermonuclease family protein [Chloroflexota bacterium]
MTKHTRLWTAVLVLALLLVACDTAPSIPTSTPMPAPTAIPASSPTPTTRPTAAPPPTAQPGSRTEALVTEIDDGDTILVDIDSIEYRVRFLGIDTPETHHPEIGADWLGYEATDYLKSMLSVGDTVILEKEISEMDHYGRLLRHVWKGDVHLNAEMVKSGLASATFYDPDLKYEDEFRTLRKAAMKAGLGMWGPRPTPPAAKQEFEHETVYLVSPTGQDTVPLLDDANRGEVLFAWPAGQEVYVQDIYWDAASARWWYWVAVKGFTGWTTAESLSRDKPAVTAPDAPVLYDNYQEVLTDPAGPVKLYDAPGGATVVRELAPGTPGTLSRLGWANSQWWVLIAVNGPDGWLTQDAVQPKLRESG